jgi:hypothetical protein
MPMSKKIDITGQPLSSAGLWDRNPLGPMALKLDDLMPMSVGDFKRRFPNSSYDCLYFTPPVHRWLAEMPDETWAFAVLHEPYDGFKTTSEG